MSFPENIQGIFFFLAWCVIGCFALWARINHRPKLSNWLILIWLALLLAGAYAVYVGRTIRAHRKAQETNHTVSIKIRVSERIASIAVVKDTKSCTDKLRPE